MYLCRKKKKTPATTRVLAAVATTAFATLVETVDFVGGTGVTWEGGGEMDGLEGESGGELGGGDNGGMVSEGFFDSGVSTKGKWVSMFRGELD